MDDAKSRRKAAEAWCTPNTENIKKFTMVPVLETPSQPEIGNATTHVMRRRLVEIEGRLDYDPVELMIQTILKRRRQRSRR